MGKGVERVEVLPEFKRKFISQEIFLGLLQIDLLVLKFYFSEGVHIMRFFILCPPVAFWLKSFHGDMPLRGIVYLDCIGSEAVGVVLSTDTSLGDSQLLDVGHNQRHVKRSISEVERVWGFVSFY